MFYKESEHEYTRSRKELEWAQIASKLTYCFAIDKIYNPRDIVENFKIVEKSVGSSINEYMVTPEDVSLFFQWERRGPLVKFSKHIFSKYFKGEGVKVCQ